MDMDKVCSVLTGKEGEVGMDREKVMKAIEICIKNGCKDGIPNQLCPYSSEVGCDLNQILADALELLKEQEAEISKYKEAVVVVNRR